MSGVNRGAPHPLLRPVQSGGEGHLAERGYSVVLLRTGDPKALAVAEQEGHVAAGDGRLHHHAGLDDAVVGGLSFLISFNKLLFLL